MKIVKVKIVLGTGFESWTQYFSNHPSLKTLQLRLRGRSNLYEFVCYLAPGKWMPIKNPDKIIQTVFVFGVPVGTIEMSEEQVHDCEGRHPIEEE